MERKNLNPLALGISMLERQGYTVETQHIPDLAVAGYTVLINGIEVETGDVFEIDKLSPQFENDDKVRYSEDGDLAYLYFDDLNPLGKSILEGKITDKSVPIAIVPITIE